MAKRDTDDNDRRRLKTKFVGDVEVVVKGKLLKVDDVSCFLALGAFTYGLDLQTKLWWCKLRAFWKAETCTTKLWIC